MERITDYRSWAADVPKKLPLSNLYLLPDQLQGLAEEGRLWGEKRGGGMVLLCDEGEYDALHFRVDCPSALCFPARSRPILAEIPWLEGKTEALREVEQALTTAGFRLRANCLQFSAPLTSGGTFSREGYRFTAAAPEHKNAILQLWNTQLSIYDFHDQCKQRLDRLIEEGTICSILDENAQVYGGAFLDRQGSRIACRHMVVHPAHRGKGLGRELLEYAQVFGIQHGCRTLTQWVADDNRASLAAHRSQMKQTNKKLAQYVLD